MANPSIEFNKAYQVTLNGNGTVTVSSLIYNDRIVVTDEQDNAGDNLSQLGDFAGDTERETFPNSNNLSSISQYVARTTDGRSFVYSYPVGSNPNAYVLLTNDTYQNNAVVQVVQAPFDLVCYVTGTRIRTRRGDIAVEALQVGDLAVTASGRLRPIAWIGHRDLDGGGKPLVHDHQPVRIRAGAFGPSVPARDLRLSPGHPVLVGADADNEGGALVPIMCLINGTTVSREPATRVTYWHVELDAHDILLAEGLPAESYLDWGDRAFFAEASDHALHNPDFVVPGLSGRCRPVAVDGAVVEAERARLDAVFAGELAGHGAWGADDSAWLAS